MGNDQNKSAAAGGQPMSRTAAAEKQANSAIMKTKEEMSLITKRINHKTKQAEKLRAEAKAIMQGAKTAAQKAVARRRAAPKLKRYKILEKQIDLENGKYDRLMATCDALEQQKSNIAVIEAQRIGNQAMRSGVNIDDVEDIVDETAELMDEGREIGDILARPMGDAIEDDDEDILAQLAEIEAQNQQEELDLLPSVPSHVPSLSASGRALAQKSMEDVLPEVPSGPIVLPGSPGTAEEIDSDVAALEALMA